MKYVCPECRKLHEYEEFYHQNGMCQSHEQPVKLHRYEDWLESENTQMSTILNGRIKELQDENKRLQQELDTARLTIKTFRGCPEAWHRDAAEMLVRTAVMVGEISYGRAAEMLQCSLMDIRERGWHQGPGLAELLDLVHASKRVQSLLKAALQDMIWHPGAPWTAAQFDQFDGIRAKIRKALDLLGETDD